MVDKTKVLFKRLENGSFDFVSSATLSDGDKLWDPISGVVYEIVQSGLPFSGLIAIADPDPLFTESLLDLEIL